MVMGLTTLSCQPGPQTDFLSTNADIAIYGGSAGSGKTFAMLLDPLRWINTCPEGGAVYFRRTSVQIRSEGGLFDEAKELYRPLGGIPRESPSMDIVFPHPTDKKKEGFKITFSHLQHEKNKYDFQGSQISILYWDELTHFSRSMFFYLLGRNRSTCGINPYVRGTCNPMKNSWVKDFINWWIDQESGYAIPERSGVLRWLVVYDDQDYWFDSEEEAINKFPDIPPLSVTFILARLKDNKILMDKDPGYRAKLLALSKVERERLLGDEERGGNWLIMPSAGMFFKREYFEEIDHIPPMIQVVRCWDRAATEWRIGDDNSKKPDATASVKMGKDREGVFYILDVQNERYSAGGVDRLILNTSRQDGLSVVTKGFQDPGSSGKAEAENFIKMLSGFPVTVERISKGKETMAKPMSSQAENGNIRMWSSCKNKELFYSQLEDFPEGKFDDIVDASSGAFNELNSANVGQFTPKFNRVANSTTPNKEEW